MNLLKKLTKKNLLLNKKRTIVTIIGIILSVSLITAVSSLYVSLINSLISFETSEQGNFHVAYFDVPVNDLKNFQNNRSIEEIFLTKNVGYAKLDNSKNPNKPYIFIKGFSKNSLENFKEFFRFDPFNIYFCVFWFIHKIKMFEIILITIYNSKKDLVP